jgi:Replication initiator protein, pSAM2
MSAIARLTPSQVRNAALDAGVCVRPVMTKVIDTSSGATQLVPIRCNSTREAQCPPCAERNRKLRMHQCREGWHLTEEPQRHTAGSGNDEDQPDDNAVPDDEDTERRVRSTRRREDAPDLPRLPVEDRTIGHAFVAPDGKTWRPSMFLTLTMPSYGRVTSDGVPVDPARYDYRRAALDAIHFPKLVDRFWQNLRRATGYRVQYFAAVEAQRRLAPHLHAAVRGAIPRELIRQVVAATYHQVWWPPHDQPAYVERLPEWDDHTDGYVDPDTRQPLPSWQDALDQVDADPVARPAHVMRFGSQIDMQGLVAGTPDTDRRIGYLCKYVTKSIAETYGDADQILTARARHIDRLADEVRWLPCSPQCPNWLRYGIQPRAAAAGMRPGHCGAKAHDREHLGLGGRRVLVSRLWTGKTLDRHRADRAAVVRAALEEAGIDVDDLEELSAATTDDKGHARYLWMPLPRREIDAATYVHVMLAAITQRQRWREQYAAARAGPPLSYSATGTTRAKETIP